MRRIVNWSLFLMGMAAVIYFVPLAFQPEPVTVEAGKVRCGPMQVTVDVEGRTRVRHRFVISAPFAGRVARITLREGDVLKAGMIVAQVTPAPFDPRTIQTTLAGARAADAQRQVAELDFEKARNARDQASRDRARLEQLFENGIASRKDLEQATFAEVTAQKSYEAAQFAAKAAVFEAEEAASALISADPDAPSGHGLISQIPVRSPASGRVLHIFEKSERIVNAGDPLIEVADARDLDLVFETLSSDAVKIPVGAEVFIERWGGEDTLHATVQTIEPSAFTKVSALGVEEQRVNVIALLTNPEDLLGDGYRVEGRIVIWSNTSVTKVPVSALFKKGEEWHVFVVVGNQAAARPVQIGRRNEDEAEVRSGLRDDESVILHPNDRISDGVSIRQK